MYGTDQAPKISVLLKGVISLVKHIKTECVVSICHRLQDKNKHLDYLSEIDPITRPVSDFFTSYEPAGYAKGNKRIDWLIKFTNGNSYLIDLKNGYDH